MTDLVKLCEIPNCGRVRRARGWCFLHYERWKATGNPLGLKRQPNGAGSTRAQDGYRRYVHLTADGKLRGVLEHVLVAERILGKPLPDKAVVHHADGNPSNNDPSNLVICPNQGYHRMLHTRITALFECGNANWRRCIYCGQYDAPTNLSIRHNGSAHHLKCRADYVRNKRHTRTR